MPAGIAYTFSKSHGDGENGGQEAASFQDPQSNGIVSLRTGFPFNVGQGDDLNTGSPIHPDRIKDGRLDNPTRQLWFDPTAFTRVTCNNPNRPDLCRYGTNGYNTMRAPGQMNLDFSLYKNFKMKERCSIQYRWELFNSTNTPYFGDPNGIGFATINSPDSDAPTFRYGTRGRLPRLPLFLSLRVTFRSIWRSSGSLRCRCEIVRFRQAPKPCREGWQVHSTLRRFTRAILHVTWKHEIIKHMAEFSVLDDEFFVVIAKACSNARAAALGAGHSVVYRDAAGRYVEERPEGKRFEIRFEKARPRESHIVVLRELTPNAA